MWLDIFLQNHVFSTNSGLITIVLMSIKWFDMERQPLIYFCLSDFNYQVVSNILYSLEYFECQSLNDLSPCSSFVTFTWWRAKEISLELRKSDSMQNIYKILSRLEELSWFKYVFLFKIILAKICINIKYKHRPKFGFGIGNRNQGPILVQCIELFASSFYYSLHKVELSRTDLWNSVM